MKRHVNSEFDRLLKNIINIKGNLGPDRIETMFGFTFIRPPSSLRKRLDNDESYIRKNCEYLPQ